MPSVHSMNARKCVHTQKPYPIQAFAHESSKVGGKGKKEEERQERLRAEGFEKKDSTKTNKNISDELKGLPRHSSG